jgi:hypothetical protein
MTSMVMGIWDDFKSVVLVHAYPENEQSKMEAFIYKKEDWETTNKDSIDPSLTNKGGPIVKIRPEEHTIAKEICRMLDTKFKA